MTDIQELFKQYPLYSYMFDKQLLFALNPSRYKAALCSRRAGKTKGIMLEIMQDALTYPNSLILYLALTDDSVRRLTKPVINEILSEVKIPCEIKEDGLYFENGSIINLLGADHRKKIEGFRGTKLRACVIDEAASFTEDILKYLIDEILSHALTDLSGKFIFAGSPKSHCSGAFYDATTGKEDGWYVQRWTGSDNPHVKEQFERDAKLYLKRKKVDISDPKYRREVLGEWCADDDDLLIRMFTVIPSLPSAYDNENWKSVLGVDFGFKDKTAFTIIGWKKNSKTAYVIESYAISVGNIESLGAVTEIAQHIKKLITTYKPFIVVGDPAGASKIIIDEFNKKNIPMIAAKKNEKAHYIDILNDALINQELVLINNSTTQLQKEMKKVVWNEQRTVEHENTKECDCLDATIYCFRESFAYLEKIPVKVEITQQMFEQQLLEDKIKYYTNLDKKQKIIDKLDNDLLFDLPKWDN